MKIQVKCFATLAKFQPEDSEAFDVPDGAAVDDVVEALGVPRDELNIAFVNSARVSLDHELQDGDRLGLFPLVGGG
jgi:molybdopterin converting factor small subunit